VGALRLSRHAAPHSEHEGPVVEALDVGSAYQDPALSIRFLFRPRPDRLTIRLTPAWIGLEQRGGFFCAAGRAFARRRSRIPVWKRLGNVRSTDQAFLITCS
jgi:hypothetical protein